MVKCKLNDKCEFGDLCQQATRHDSLTVLGCSSYKAKEPMTNDEWRRTCSKEKFADWLEETFDLCGAGCSKCFVQKLCFDEHNNKMPRDLMVEWLKQPHTNE